MEPLTVVAGVGIGYGLWRRFKAGRQAPKAGDRLLKERYQAAEVWPDALDAHDQWGRYSGARPELRGAPKNTMLALPGIAAWTPEERAMLLDVAEKVNIPVDALVTLISKESRADPRATFWVDEKDKHGNKTGRRLPFAVGIIQLTKGAHLPGFGSTAALDAVRAWTVEKQIEMVVEPYYKRFKSSDPMKWDPGFAYLMNFLPDDVGKPHDFALGDNRSGATKWRKSVYAMNSHFDRTKKGYFTLGEVKESAASITKQAKGRRITVDGRIIEPPRKAPKAQRGPLKDVYDAKESAGGILLACVMAGKYEEPTWVPVKLPDGIEVLVTADALKGKIAVRWPAVELPKDALEKVKEKATAQELADLQKPQVNTASWRLPVSYTEQVEIAKHFGAISATKEIWDASFEQAGVKAKPNPDFVKGAKGQPDGTLEQQNRFDQTLGNSKTVLFRDVGKGWILHPRIAESGAVNYGWIDPKSGKPIQSVGARHGPNHFDYSQTCVLVKRFGMKNGQKVDLLDEYDRAGIPRRYLDVYK